MKIYHTETQADYDVLMVELEEQGVKWPTGTNPTEDNNWPEFERQTGIKVQDCRLTYHGVEYFERANPETPIIKYTAKKETQLPEWANWVARDEDGTLNAFENKPFKSTDIGMWFDNEHSSEMVEETDDAFEGIVWTLDEPTKIKRIKGPGVSRILAEELDRITSAKAHGYDEVPEVADKTERVHADETTSISFEEAMDLVENKMDDEVPEQADMVNHPNHYKQGGLETIDIMQALLPHEQFIGYLKGNIIKYRERAEHKGNAEQDYAKAKWYYDKLMEVSN